MLRDLRSRLSGWTRRQPKSEASALLAAALGRDATAVHCCDLLHDRQPEAAAAYAISTAAAIERLKQMLKVTRGDAGAALFDADVILISSARVLFRGSE